MKLRKKLRPALAILCVQLALEAPVISHLVRGDIYSITERDTVSHLFLISMLLTPVAALFTFSRFSFRQFFKEGNEMYKASFLHLRGLEARVSYLFNEGRLPFMVMLYISHFMFINGFFNSLSAYHTRTINEYPVYVVWGIALNPLLALSMLVVLILVLKRRTPIGVTKKMEHNSQAEFYTYSRGYITNWVYNSILRPIQHFFKRKAKKNALLYIHLFRGRLKPNYPLDLMHETDLLIGPVDINWIFGDIHIHNPYEVEDSEILPLTPDGDFVHIDLIYYSDFEILSAKDPFIKEKLKKKDIPTISCNDFFALIRKPNTEEAERIEVIDTDFEEL